MRSIRVFFEVFLLWILIGIISKVAFLLINHDMLGESSFYQQLPVLWYGLRLDTAIAGYLTMLPGLLLIIKLWCHHHVMHVLWRGYFVLAAFLSALAYTANIGLYQYWGFPLDDTSLLYIRTSPADALASMAWWQLLAAVTAITIVTIAICRCMPALPHESTLRIRKRAAVSVLLLVLTASLLLPIRGGVGTGTNHTGSVYFSENIRLNHAAVNPVFSFVEAVVHHEEIGNRYRFMDEDEAASRFRKMSYTALRQQVSSTPRRPHVILIVLESFSDTLMRVKGVTPNLLRLADEGMYFSRFYSNSFRTDRALVSIHSGFPAQPTMSVMDMPRRSTSLPSIAGTLAKHGYQTTFYYGGDINYSNMRSYFMGTGFQEVVSETDFPVRLHTGKWGVADGPVFNRVLEDIKGEQTAGPFFRSIMTSSSHEPFDVPDYNKIKNSPVLNAFSYADACLGKFIDGLKALPCWKNTLVAIVPDHLGAWPDNADNYLTWRYKIPFIITGGAAGVKGSFDVIGSQIDIAATLLAMLGIDHRDFVYSKDLLDEAAPHFAFFTFPDAMGLVNDSSSIVYDNVSVRTIMANGHDTDSLEHDAKAYLQILYDDLDKR